MQTETRGLVHYIGLFCPLPLEALRAPHYTPPPCWAIGELTSADSRPKDSLSENGVVPMVRASMEKKGPVRAAKDYSSFYSVMDEGVPAIFAGTVRVPLFLWGGFRCAGKLLLIRVRWGGPCKTLSKQFSPNLCRPMYEGTVTVCCQPC